MENKERSQPEAQYQRELEGVRNDVACLTSMLEQMLRVRDGEGTSTQHDETPAAAQIPVAPINMGANTPNKQNPNPTQPIQIPITMDLTNEDPHDFRFSNHEGYDKWNALEERLRAIEGNDLFDPIRAAEQQHHPCPSPLAAFYEKYGSKKQVAPPTSNRPSLYCTMSKHNWNNNSLLSRNLPQPSTVQSSILLCVSKTQLKLVERGRTKRQRTREDEEESKTQMRECPIRQCTNVVGFVSSYVSSSFPSFPLL
ncbi:hypothetical protein NC652_032388 [Populus alba x Populus x berolinensis]|nr:hypothetical protein NC652_032388 [Populus alba x Populus x berolinensis]